MFGKSLVADLITRSAETEADRRNFLRAAGLAGLGAVGATVAGTAGATAASAASGLSDATVLNFALNLEYLEAEFYSYAVYGRGLDDGDTTGTGTRGAVTGGKKAPLTGNVAKYAEEIANDEIAHVRFLRRNLASAAVARPAIDFTASFSAAAQAAGLVPAGGTFDPFASDDNFLLAAFVFEDVGVTAYKGASPFIANDTFLEAAAGILAVEAYHAGLVRSQIYKKQALAQASNKISDARDLLDGTGEKDQGVLAGRDRAGRANLVPTDANSIAFSRTPQQVLNVVYLNAAKGVANGGFFPDGVNSDAGLTTT